MVDKFLPNLTLKWLTLHYSRADDIIENTSSIWLRLMFLNQRLTHRKAMPVGSVKTVLTIDGRHRGKTMFHHPQRAA